MLRALVVGLSLGMAFVGSARADGDAANGQSLFKKKCAACHQAEKATNGVGPHLVGVYGRHNAAVADFTRYSDNFKKLNVNWDDETLAKWLSDPKAMAPGTAMNILGGNVKDPKELADIIAYLKTLKAS